MPDPVLDAGLVEVQMTDKLCVLMGHILEYEDK